MLNNSLSVVSHLRLFCWEFSDYICMPFLKLDYLVFWCLVSWVCYIFWRSVLCPMWGWLRSFSIQLAAILSYWLWLYLSEASQFQEALSIFCCSQCLRKWSSVPIHSRLLPTFSSVRLSVAGFCNQIDYYLNCHHRTFIQQLMKADAEILHWALDQTPRVQLLRGRGDNMSKGAKTMLEYTDRNTWPELVRALWLQNESRGTCIGPN